MRVELDAILTPKKDDIHTFHDLCLLVGGSLHVGQY
jgi:hypothetical protein